MKITALVVIIGCALIVPSGVLAAPASEDAGVGFIVTSDQFEDPCTSEPGDIPILYYNHSSNSVDVSIKFVKTGNSDLHITGTGFNLGPTQRRPLVFRVTLSPLTTIGVQAFGPGRQACGWSAVVRPH